MKDQKAKWSRRRFLGSAAAGVAGAMLLPGIVGCKSTAKKPGDIRLGFIGMGQQSMFLLNGFIQIPGVQVLAGCDVYGIKRKRFEKRVTEFYKKAGKEAKVETYEKYQDLLNRKDIDAVVIAVPDHSHAMIAIAACKAGKDVYLEKPMTFTIKEGQELRKTVRETGRILAVGSQQRSDPNFQHAVDLVQKGALGKITNVNAYVGAPPIPYNLPEEPIPADLNWDLWLGSLPMPIHFNNQLDPPISLEPEQNEQMWGAWRWYKEMGGGFTTDWGAHMFDIAQWGLGMDKSGPVEISPIGDGTEYMTFKYASGTVMTSEPFNEEKTKGVKFIGENGWIEVARGYFKASDPKFVAPETAKTEGPYETKIPHQVNFIESVRSRKDPAVPVEIGHRSCTVCNLGNIACELKRTIKWNPETETFVDDT
ncbi:MAG TPA: Gfo/Idh/MocA family oxidoreductase, partial [Bacteroidales bacterium]|nr:Gfo/Idh/MocA family oxidoreductase [Bacteroidales bacterium]